MINSLVIYTMCCVSFIIGFIADMSRYSGSSQKPLKVYHLICFIIGFVYVIFFIFIPRTKMFKTLISWLNSEVGGEPKK